MGDYVLGLGGSNHDFSAALVRDGRIVVALEDERIQRVKRGRVSWDARPCQDAVEQCLLYAGIGLDGVDAIYCCDDLERPTSWLDWSRVTFVNHHTAHAAAAYYPFPYPQSTLLVVDGHGSALDEVDDAYEVETISTGWADGNELSVAPLQVGHQRRTSSSWRYVTQNSIGWFYKIVTMALGFGSTGVGKTMGLAAYGTPARLLELRKFVQIHDDGRFEFDPYEGIWDWLTDELRDAGPRVKADLAYAAQEILGDAIVAAATAAFERAPSPTLGFGGGCALNTLANTRILTETSFENLCVFPASGDNGLAVGAALYGAHAILDHDRPPPRTTWRSDLVYLGPSYDDAAVDAALQQAPVLSFKPADLVAEVAGLLAAGASVGLSRGRSEIGPRALGHRSLLALPDSVRIRDKINLELKDRESFRPLAPMVPLEDVNTYFSGVAESPFMLLVATVRPEFRQRLAAVTHSDGTARVQTVRAEDEPFIHALLCVVGELTGVPVLVNTSLNRRDEPIVETPEDAVALFIERPLDALVLEDRLVTKYTPWVQRDALATWTEDADRVPPR